MNFMSSIRFSVFVCAVLALSVSASAQTTRYVSLDGECDGNTPCYSTIQAALDASTGGDEIIVAPGTYAPISFSASGGRTIRSCGGPEVTIIDAGGVGGVITVSAGQLTLQGFTITNGHRTGSNGGGLRGGWIPSITIDDCIFLNNTADSDGGAIGGGLTDLVITNSSFIGNSAGQDGGAIRGTSSGYNAHITNCVFQNNTAGRRGGAALTWATTLIGCTFEGNSAHDTTWGGGGAIYGGASPAHVIDDCHFTNNTATSNGGAIYLASSSSVPFDFITNCTFTNNTAGDSGGGVIINSGGAKITDSTLTGNTAGTGGAATLLGNSSIDNCTVTDNVSTGDGGGVRLEGNASIINSMVTGNSAGGNGGGLWIHQASTTACVITGNTAAGNGGGLCMIGATATDCTITGNAATGRGGGAYAQPGASHLINCEIVTNTAGNTGGGVYIMDTALVNLIDSTVCPNTPDLIDFHIGGMLLTMNSISCELTCPGGGDPIGACCMSGGECVSISEAACLAAGGTYQGDGASCGDADCPAPEPTCIGDINLDGVVDGIDLLMILSNWGTCS